MEMCIVVSTYMPQQRRLNLGDKTFFVDFQHAVLQHGLTSMG